MTKKVTSTFALLFIMAFTLLLAGCKGPAGDDGSKGSKGAQGEQGPVGPAGDDGSVMYAGKGAPAGETGNEGDYYLNNDTGELYGPKGSEEWSENPSIILMGSRGAKGDKGDQGPKGDKGDAGPQGADGQDGTQIYSGTAAPSSSKGVPGDYFLDEVNYDVYGPKTSSGWGTPINIKGADGNANVTLYVYNVTNYTSSNPSHTVTISGLELDDVQKSQWNFAFIRGALVQFIPGKISFGAAGNLSEFTVELFYDINTGDTEFTIELINGSDYYPDKLHIYRTVPSNIKNKNAEYSGRVLVKKPNSKQVNRLANTFGLKLAH